METIIRRKVADKTRENILKAAFKLFAKQGFSATSTLAIAKAAKVNETLIFHHFGNKEKLWQKVKSFVIENLDFPDLNPQPQSLRAFLVEAITQRLSAYDQKPGLARLLQWQFMEDKQEELFAGNTLAPINWLPALRYLQAEGKIKADLVPEIIMAWLSASVNVLIFNPVKALQLEENKEEYISTLLDGFELALQQC